jgi:Domain of unknown function (DUF4926)
MAFVTNGDVILTRYLTEHGLRGDAGTVVEGHLVSGVAAEEGCSVEFFDMTANTVAVVTLPASPSLPDTSRASP